MLCGSTFRLRGPCCCLQHYYLPRWSSFFRTGEERAPGLGPRPRALLPYVVSAAQALCRLLCHRSNSVKIPLRRTAILTPQRRECAPRLEHGLRFWPYGLARPGLLGTPGPVFLVIASTVRRAQSDAAGCASCASGAGAPLAPLIGSDFEAGVDQPLKRSREGNLIHRLVEIGLKVKIGSDGKHT
jgi:hypothetical protein